MAITPTQLQFRVNGKVAISGRLNNLFSNAYTNGGQHFAWLEIWNQNDALTLSSVKAWVKPDSRGGVIAIAYDSASGVIAQSAGFDTVDPLTLSYSTPLTAGTGLTLGNLLPDTKLRLSVRRTLTNGTPASPENNAIMVTGTSPI